MLNAAAIVFVIGALGGVVLAVSHWKKKDAPLPLAILHGLLGATGLVLLTVGVSRLPSAGLTGVALGTYLVAALGGFVLFAMHLKKKRLPLPLMGGHALLAILGTVLLMLSRLHV